VATERQPRNPYIVWLGVVGGIAGAIAVICAAIAGRLADEYNWTTDSNFVEIDVVAIERLSAWAEVLGIIAIVGIAGALIVAAARWTPEAPAANPPRTRPQPQLDGNLYPPGGLTDAERRLLDEDEAR
jgi:uncharacterized membrane protein